MTEPGGTGGSSLGGTIGSRVASHLQRAVAQTKVQLGPHQAAIAQQILRDFTNHISDEIRSAVSPLWTMVASEKSVAPWLRELTGKLGTERGQAWAWIGGSAVGGAMAGGLGHLLANELAVVFGPAVASNPNLGLDVSSAGAALARGLISDGSGLYDLARAGLDEERSIATMDLNRTVPTPGEIIELAVRGEVNRAQAETLLRRVGVGREHWPLYLALGERLISIQDASAMANRSILSAEELRVIARRNGYTDRDAERFDELAGEPLSVGDLMAALRRGIIDSKRFERGWVQGPTRNEWRDVAEQLQYTPMSTVDAASAVLQGHMDESTGRRIAAWNGLMPEHFDTLIESAGLPPGVELASEALNRGLMTEEEFRIAFLESRLKNRYVDLYVKLRHRVVPQETVRRLYRTGVWDRQKSITRLGWAGFSPEDAVDLISGEEGEAAQADRELTKSEVLTLLTDRAISEDDARAMLGILGYSQGAIEWQITLAEVRRSKRHTEAVITRIRSSYVTGRLGLAETTALFDRLRIPPAQREDLITIWDLDRLATTRGLTAAQVQAAMRRGLLTPEEGYAELAGQGYSDRDAGILVSLASPARQ